LTKKRTDADTISTSVNLYRNPGITERNDMDVRVSADDQDGVECVHDGTNAKCDSRRRAPSPNRVPALRICNVFMRALLVSGVAILVEAL
jgi:hypothetical protein